MKYFIYCRKSSESEDRQILSVDSQASEASRLLQTLPDVEIVEVLREAYSAKSPGRPVFSSMITRIERGEAEGIVAWHPDRLARNSLDGGRIIYLLDRKILKDLKFSTFTFENNPQGKFMLSIMLGYSKYYVDSLSENVKRGNRAKLERGWRPNQAPLGYINDKETKTIIKDPIHFPLVRKMYELMLTGTYSPKQIALIARDEWAFHTPQKKRTGGKPLAMSTVYKILTNPFYAGILVWNNQTFPGKHEPVVTIDEMDRVQELLGRPGRARPKRHQFPFTGMIRCGSCNHMVTAEHKVNRFGSRYIYYHCTHRTIGPNCAERAIEARDLDFQIFRFLEELVMSAAIFQVVQARAHDLREHRVADQLARRFSLEAALKNVTDEQSELTGLRLRNILADEEFLAKRKELKQNELRLHQQVESIPEDENEFEPISNFIILRNKAAAWFSNGSSQTKKQIVHITGSNLSLKTKILNIEAKQPFRRLEGNINYSQQLAFIDDVRTWVIENREEARTLSNTIRELAKQAALEEKKAA